MHHTHLSALQTRCGCPDVRVAFLPASHLDLPGTERADEPKSRPAQWHFDNVTNFNICYFNKETLEKTASESTIKYTPVLVTVIKLKYLHANILHSWFTSSLIQSTNVKPMLVSPQRKAQNGHCTLYTDWVINKKNRASHCVCRSPLLKQHCSLLYLARHRLPIVEQVVFFHFAVFCLQLSCLSVLCIVQQYVYLTHWAKQSS